MKSKYVPYDFAALKSAAIGVILEGDPYWREKTPSFFDSYTLIELVEWAIKDTFMHQIPYNEKHDILRSAMTDFREDRFFKARNYLSHQRVSCDVS